jgi:Fe-S-cluster containining protein
MCCRYVATKIDAPRTKIDWDEIYWFLCHDNVEVFIESRKWYVLFDTPCRNLDAKSRCVVYPRRPYVCGEHEEENCEYWGEEEGKVTMRTPEDLKAYMKRRGVRLRMAWDDPDEKAEKKTSSKPRTRRSKKG